MAQEYSFTQQERNNLFAPSKVYSSFGKDTTNDYIALYVYDINDTLLVTRIMGLDEVEFTNDGSFGLMVAIAILRVGKFKFVCVHFDLFLRA